MATTHAFVGLLFGAVVSVLFPEFANQAILAGFLGGFFPDLDLYADHRRTLHFPTYYTLFGVITGIIALLFPSVITISLGVFVNAAAIHSRMDIFGGGLELKPWEEMSNRAVYDHFKRKWYYPRRLIRYDGAPEDFIVCTLVALPGIVIVSGTLQLFLIGLVIISGVYALVRKRLPDLALQIINLLPTKMREYLPERFVADIVSDQ
ncbi:MAG: metal-dependent hydrolase [Halobacteriaceae archaeon]